MNLQWWRQYQSEMLRAMALTAYRGKMLTLWPLGARVWIGADAVVTQTPEHDRAARLAGFDCEVLYLPKLLCPEKGADSKYS